MSKRTCFIALMAFGLMGFLVIPDRLLASCGQATCPIDTGLALEQPLYGRELKVDLSYEFIDQDRVRRGRHKVGVGEIPSRFHDEVYTRNQGWKLSVDWGITPRLSLNFSLPYLAREHHHIVNEEHGHSNHEEEEEREVERWNFSDLGDITTLVRYVILLPDTPDRPALSLGVGMKFPTGATRKHNIDGERAEATLQPGSGSYDTILGLYYQQSLRAKTLSGELAYLPLFASGTFRINGRGKEDWRAGDEVQLHLGTSYTLSRKIELVAQVNALFRDRIAPGRALGLDERNSGGEWLYLSPGLRFHVSEGLSAYGYFQLPVYQRVNRIQNTSDYNLLFGFSYRFGWGSLGRLVQ